MFLQADSEDQSYWANAQVDLSPHWVHRSFCLFCCVAAHFTVNSDKGKGGSFTMKNNVQMQIYELRHKKTCHRVCSQVRLKPACSATEAAEASLGYRN